MYLSVNNEKVYFYNKTRSLGVISNGVTISDWFELNIKRLLLFKGMESNLIHL